MSTDYVDGFLRYDAFPQNSFAKRDLPVPRLGRAHEVRGGNSKLVKGIAWSCDGRRVATGTECKGLRVWDASPRPGGAAGVSVDPGRSFGLPSSSKTPSPHNGHVASLAWSPTDPNVLVSGCKGASGGGVVAVWDVTRPAAPLANVKIAGDVLHLAFHPSGTQFAAVCPRNTRDDVYFFRQDENGAWVQRDDIMMGGAGIDIGVEEINSLRFWLGGDCVMSVSNDGSLTSWWYPLDERPPLAEPPKPDIDERPTKKLRTESPTAAPTPGPEEEGGEDAERDGSDGEGREAEETEEAESEDKPNGETEGGEDKANGDGGDAETPAAVDIEVKVDVPDNDVEMADGSAEASAAPTAAPSAVPSPAPSAPASVAPSAAVSRAPTPAPDAKAAEAAANELELAEKRARAAAELAQRKHKQLERCYRQVPHVGGLLALAIDPLGRFLAVGGQDARMSLLSSYDWSVQRNFDAPTAAIRHAAFSPDGELLAVGGDDNCIFVFAVFARTTVARIPVTGSVNALAWCPVRNVLAYSTNSKAGIVWYLVHQE